MANYKATMNSIGQHEFPPEPAPELVECAIAEVLEIAERQGITAADFIQMLDLGMSISVFLNAIDAGANADPIIDCHTVN